MPSIIVMTLICIIAAMSARGRHRAAATRISTTALALSFRRRRSRLLSREAKLIRRIRAQTQVDMATIIARQKTFIIAAMSARKLHRAVATIVSTIALVWRRSRTVALWRGAVI